MMFDVCATACLRMSVDHVCVTDWLALPTPEKEKDSLLGEVQFCTLSVVIGVISTPTYLPVETYTAYNIICGTLSSYVTTLSLHTEQLSQHTAGTWVSS